MNLVAITRLLTRLPSVVAVSRRLASSRPGEAASVRVLEAAKAPLLAGLALSPEPIAPCILVITPTHNRARELADTVKSFADDPDSVVLLPEPGTAFYEAAYSDAAQVQARAQALWQMASGKARIVVVSVRALMQRVSPPEAFRYAVLTMQPGQSVRPLDLVERWARTGYNHVPIVEEPGEFSRRGGILDIWPVGSRQPVRLEFFGDEIESLRSFDPVTQRSQSRVDRVEVLPAADLLAQDARTEDLDQVDTSHLAEAPRQRWERALERLRLGERFDGIDLFAAYLPAVSALDYVGADTLVVLDEAAAVQASFQALSAQQAEARANGLEAGELPSGLAEPHLTADDIESRLRAFRQAHVTWGSIPSRGLDLEAEIMPVEVFAGRTNAALDRAISDLKQGAAIVVVSQQTKRLAEMLADRDIQTRSADEVTSIERGSITLVHGTIPEGFEAETEQVPLRLLTDSELFGVAKISRPTRRREARHSVVVSELEPGCFVVHVEHGVGRYRGLVKMTTDGVDRDYLLIEYAAEDRLYVPVDQADRVDRYIGPGDSSPSLHRLGTTDWNRAKARVRAAVQEMAEELLQLYATRESVEGHAFSPDGQWQADLESSFPFVETPDQVEALAEIKQDMEQPKPMDRLLCGDVGFGKTELALRAAFKAVNDGKQVAVLVPTTVLAQQHDRTFRDRLRPFPVRIEMLSRFRSEREQDAVVSGLAAGTVDICVGTHRLIQKDVEFKDLGLVIIDEEQRFGVGHKERLKQLRKEVDVLTLSATPIPRTLQMALSGVRDMSVMETPPEDRLPIKTYVHEYDEHVIRESILREIDRGGQVYFVHNRVQTIYSIASRLRDLVPEARYLIGHGQLPEDTLEQVMLDFAAGKSDVLVCSTIIESGLDIPNVNTIIVNRADTFGLAQLYQLRGRVGRGANRAFSYFLYPKGRQLSEVAEKRLRTIFEASDLGAGLKIAMKDLEIRGAGNLLGAEQHGHVAAVGFHMYTQLLAEAVSRLRGQPQQRRLTTSVDLPLEAFIPEEYIADEALRLNIYQRLASATNPDRLGQLALELQDRFGPASEPVLNLLFVAQARCSASLGLVESIAMEGKEVILRRPQGIVFRREDFPPDFSPWLRIGVNQVGIRADDGMLRWQARLSAVLDHLVGPRPDGAPAANARPGVDVSGRSQVRPDERGLASPRLHPPSAPSSRTATPPKVRKLRTPTHPRRSGS